MTRRRALPGRLVASCWHPSCCSVAARVSASLTASAVERLLPNAQAPPGGPGCGFASAAFCEEFQGPRNTSGNRNGDLSTARFSVSRWRSERSDDGNQHASGGPTPPGDVRIESGRAVIDVGMQNYGDVVARVNQPFDFADGGTIRFDTSLDRPDGLWGWPTVQLLADPYSAPSYDDDNSRGPLPAGRRDRSLPTPVRRSGRPPVPQPRRVRPLPGGRLPGLHAAAHRPGPAQPCRDARLPEHVGDLRIGCRIDRAATLLADPGRPEVHTRFRLHRRPQPRHPEVRRTGRLDDVLGQRVVRWPSRAPVDRRTGAERLGHRVRVPDRRHVRPVAVCCRTSPPAQAPGW